MSKFVYFYDLGYYWANRCPIWQFRGEVLQLAATWRDYAVAR